MSIFFHVFFACFFIGLALLAVLLTLGGLVRWSQNNAPGWAVFAAFASFCAFVAAAWVSI